MSDGGVLLKLLDAAPFTEAELIGKIGFAPSAGKDTMKRLLARERVTEVATGRFMFT